jgi:ATP/maltotriose-dependent transcriptional regulator MalT/DNA-binding SARP family transcriptional activator
VATQTRTLSGKLLPPERPDIFVRRPQLLARLNEAHDRRLTTVVAGAGFGKSTLVGAWARAPTAAWLTCDRADRDLGTFVRGLADALRLRLPRLGGELQAVAERTHDVSRAEPLASLVCARLDDDLGEDLVLALDDLHELGRTSGSIRLIAALCRQAPAAFHLVLVSREAPPFAVERLRGRGELVALEAGDLAFTSEETGELVEAVLGRHDGELAGKLFELTGGWPAAVRLAAESLRTQPERAIARVVGAGGPLAAYVAEAALTAQPAPVRELLRAVAPFERVSVGLCTALGIDRAAERLGMASERGLLARLSADEPWFVMHEIVRTAVGAAWPLDERERRELVVRGAAWLEQAGHVEEALRSLLALGDGRRVARILADHGSALVSAGAVSIVVHAGEAIPHDERGPDVDQLVGHAYFLLGDWQKAQACLERVATRFDRLPAALAWRLAQVHHLRGAFEEILRLRERVGSDPASVSDETRLLSFAAVASWLSGAADDADRMAKDAVDRALALDESDVVVAARNAAGIVASGLGRHDEAVVHLMRAAEVAERGGDLLGLLRTRVNLADPLLAEGRYVEALEHLAAALELAEVSGYVFFQALALNNRAAAYLALGRLDEAYTDFEASVRLYASIGGWEIVPLAGLGDVHRERGDHVSARAAYERTLSVAVGAGEPPILVTARSGLARLLAIDDPVEARRLADTAAAQGPAPGATLGLLAGAWVALAAGDAAEAMRLADLVVVAAGERNEPPALAEALELRAVAVESVHDAVAALAEAEALWARLDNALGVERVRFARARLTHDRDGARRATRVLHRLGVRVEAAAGAAGLLMAVGPEEPAVIRIQTLGDFRVVRRGVLVPNGEWQSRKARAVLKILIARRGRPTPREIIMDLLWPGEDTATVAKRLSVAVSTIRAVLDPGGRLGADHFLGGDATTLALNVANLDIDLNSFLTDFHEGLSRLRDGRAEDALPALEAAEASYGGEFLPDELYADWAASPREEARTVYAAVLHALASLAAARGDSDAAVLYLLRLLRSDPDDEGAHLALVRAQMASGRHGDARRAYRAYAERMTALGVEPAPFPANP